MEQNHYKNYLIKIPKDITCEHCKKDTGKREYYHYNNLTLLGCIAACFTFPVCACGLCCNEAFQERKVYCLNCNRIIN